MKKLFLLIFLIAGKINAQNKLSTENSVRQRIIKPGVKITADDIQNAFNRVIAFSDSIKNRNTHYGVQDVNTIISYNVEKYSEKLGQYVSSTGTNINAGTKFVCFAATQNDSIWVSSVTNGSAVHLARFFGANNNYIGQQDVGIDGVDLVWAERKLNIPSGTTRIVINCRSDKNVIIKRRSVGFNALASPQNYQLVNVPVVSGFYMGKTGSETKNSTRKYCLFGVNPGDRLRITSNISGDPIALVVYKDSIGNYVSHDQVGTNGVTSAFTNYETTVPSRASIAYVNGGAAADIMLIERSSNRQPTQWEGYYVLWLGTSIPEGGYYPFAAPALLGAAGINRAKGSSVVRIANSSGTITGIPYENYLYSLGHTISEKISIINNWSTIRSSLAGTTPASLSPADTSLIIGCSYQKRLLPYLDGTLPMPSLFVLDHGRNDNFGSDNDSLWTKTPISSQRLNRNTFMGATNVLIELIYRYNPRARIVIISHNTNKGSWARVVNGQRLLAEYWNLPFLDLSQKLGWSDQLAPGSQSLWASSPWSLYTFGQNTSLDMSLYRIWNPDGTHLYTSWSRQLVTNVCFEFLRGLY
ncbi:hypothetical protein [Runella slithyformis]|uniref:Uncharacterized protein n=1 Tax=Runella slithyformis (strain ATCC 29530 / DSM 19594 / LMG 11500 / NCIMB 11436 / LSU 4) TaxID=761193 RepID=A0A7U3ZI94_RUNSL|nr:hypothetical protein [Runella slithyformis]AEI47678.1 hypothetical protein Runsl_1251 [Runella slithyformis DSM 19594]